MLRRTLDIVVLLLAVCLAAALCSFFTVYQPVLRVVFDALAAMIGFLLRIGSYWQLQGKAVLADFAHSAAALAAAMGIALLAGVPAGIFAGTRPNSLGAGLIRLVSYLGIMLPSFLLALCIMVIFVLGVLPLTGVRFILLTSQTTDFDPRRLIPIALTLSVRPLALFTSITASTVYEVLERDFIRTAHSKGLSRQQVLRRHTWPHVVPVVLSTIAPALLFAISSLPIVEFVFNWPGVGQELLFRIVASPAPDATNAALVSFLFASLGLTYLTVVLLTDRARRHFEPHHSSADRL